MTISEKWEFRALQVKELDLGYISGHDRLLLRLPVMVRHHLTPDSPVAKWATPTGLAEDADSEIVIVVWSLHFFR